MFAVVTFSVALLSLTALFVLKDFELRRNAKMLPGLRARVHSFFESRVVPIKEKLPEAGKESAISILKSSERMLLGYLMRGLHATEQLLLRAFLFIRGQRTILRKSASVSSFLRDIADHKRTLGGNTESPQI